MTKIFISHSSSDSDFARQLAEALIEVGISVWIDVADIPAGIKWSTAIQQALDACDAMIVILTPDAMNSVNVEDEWQYYLDEGKRIFPVRLQPAKVHFQLRRLQYIDFHKKDFIQAFNRLRVELDKQGISTATSGGEVHEIQSFDSSEYGFSRDSVSLFLPSPFEWIWLPSGQVKIVDTSDEGGTNGGIFEVPEFGISKYPITNAQYQVFVDSSDGYNNSAWWEFSEYAKKWRQENPVPLEPFSPEYDLPRHNVSGYEAVAFCRWVSANTNLEISLPNEQEWQWAAVGDTGRIYPWGNHFDPTKGHLIRQVYINDHKEPITRYPEGASIFGVMDMVGNVWEWTLTEWTTGISNLLSEVERVVKGGTTVPFGLGSGNNGITASDRVGMNPAYSNLNAGFRIATHSVPKG